MQTLGRVEHARELGLRAALRIRSDSIHVELTVTAPGSLPDSIRLTVAHPTRSGLDQELLVRGRSGVYEATLAPLSTGRWLFVIQDEARSWRMDGSAYLPCRDGDPDGSECLSFLQREKHHGLGNCCSRADIGLLSLFTIVFILVMAVPFTVSLAAIWRRTSRRPVAPAHERSAPRMKNGPHERGRMLWGPRGPMPVSAATRTGVLLWVSTFCVSEPSSRACDAATAVRGHEDEVAAMAVGGVDDRLVGHPLTAVSLSQATPAASAAPRAFERIAWLRMQPDFANCSGVVGSISAPSP